MEEYDLLVNLFAIQFFKTIVEKAKKWYSKTMFRCVSLRGTLNDWRY